MNKIEAKRILEKPVFGDPECIAAVKFLEKEADADELRKVLLNKRVKCWCCSGQGKTSCDCGHSHECGGCNGARTREMTSQFMADMSLAELAEIAEELGITLIGKAG